MSNVTRIYPQAPLLETPIQDTLPHADGTRIPWTDPRRLLFRRLVRPDGSIVDFERNRVTESIVTALSQTDTGAQNAIELTDRVIIFLANRFKDRLLSTTGSGAGS